MATANIRHDTNPFTTTGTVAGLHLTQAQFVDSTAYISALIGGRGVGKTYAGAYKVMTKARNKEPWMSVSPDSGVIIDTTLPTFVELARHHRKLIRYVKSPYPRVWFKTLDGGTADIIMRSGEKPDKLRGPNKAGLWLDEASVMIEDVFEIAIATLRIKGASNQVFMTLTPRGRHHWTFSRFYEPLDDYETIGVKDSEIININGSYFKKKPQTEVFQAASYMNPFLPEEYAERLFSQYTKAFAEQEVEGNFVDLAGLLFARADFQQMDAISVPREAARVRYWDLAGSDESGSHTVGLLMARDKQGRFIIENVVRGQWSAAKRNEMIKSTAEIDALRYDNEVVIYVEQEGGSGGKEQMNQIVLMLAGYPVYRDVVSGARTRRKDGLILPGRAKVTRAAPFAAMVENHGVYIVKGKWNGEYLDEMIAFPESSVADQVDACFIAGTKITTLSGESDIESIRVGDIVLTRFGWRKVVQSGQVNAVKTTITIRITGRPRKWLTCTPEHKILTRRPEGFVQAQYLVRGDRVVGLERDGREQSMTVESIVSINHDDSIPVYDLTIDDVPEFVAEGIVVHNSSGAFNKLAFKNLQTRYTPEQLKSDELMSHAAQINQRQSTNRRRRGTEEPNPRRAMGNLAKTSKRIERNR